VVENRETLRVVGLLTEQHALRRYTEELDRRSARWLLRKGEPLRSDILGQQIDRARLYIYFNYIGVRSFVLNGAPFRQIGAEILSLFGIFSKFSGAGLGHNVPAMCF